MTHYERIKEAKTPEELAQMFCRAIEDHTPEGDYICDNCPLKLKCSKDHNAFAEWLKGEI